MAVIEIGLIPRQSTTVPLHARHLVMVYKLLGRDMVMWAFPPAGHRWCLLQVRDEFSLPVGHPWAAGFLG